MLSTLRWAILALAAGAAGSAASQALPNEPLRPLPEKIATDSAKVALGRALFHDVRFSRDNKQSCASCHQLQRGGADGKALSVGANGKPGLVNTPTVYNSSLNFRQSWSGRYASIDELLAHVVARPTVFATSWDAVSAKLAGDPALAGQVRAIYGSAVAPAHLQDALSHFLHSLVTPSRFDRYLRGDANAISAEEKAGYARFKSYGCVACHQGVNVGGNMFQKFGAMRDLPWPATGGRVDVTGREADRHLFRVPSLRNVALTAPYLHDGSVATLDQAVEAMFTYQLGRAAAPEERALIVRFLNALTGEKLAPAGAPP